MKRILRTILLALLVVAPLKAALGEVLISVNFAPPALPVYDLPDCPGDGYLWVPGYWAWDVDDGYYWIPGYWDMAPEVGYLWTPAWWGWDGGVFVFHDGYWGPHVGFYGGINYGFGYFGVGFAGGRWDGGHFFYNSAVFNVGVNFHNTYRDTTVINNTTIVNNHVSYNGGDGGVRARPTPEEETYDHEQHRAPSTEQMQHAQTARSNPQMRASVNQGRPAIAATDRPGSFSGRGVVPASAPGGEYHQPAGAPGGEARPGAPAEEHPAERVPAGEDHPNTPAEEHPATPTHASDLAPHQAEPVPSTGDPRTDLRNQEDEQKLVDQQNKEHQQLTQQQQKEDQQMQKQNASDQQKQQTEQKHQQQTQEMEQRHAQQTQTFHSHAQPARPPHQ
jgi:WXXGXW repeat (2 copies)